MFKHEPHPDYQPAFGFYSNFPTSILISVSWYSPGVLPWIEFYTIRTRYSLRRRFKHWLSIQKEYFKFLIQITLKLDGIFFFAMCEHCRYTGVPKDGNRRVGSSTSQFAYKLIRLLMQVDSPTWSDESSLLFVVHALHLILFVEEYTCGGHVGLDSYWPICKVGVHLYYYYYFYTRSCSDPFS